MRAWDYPKDRVVIACTDCKRRGAYSKARFVESVGRDTPLPDALRIIASDCRKAENKHLIGFDRCKAHYPEL